jgi:hypothetical protein
MGQQLLNRIVGIIEMNPNFSWILDCDLRPISQSRSVSPSGGFISSLFLSSVPCALDAYREFPRLIYAVLSQDDQALLSPLCHMRQIIALILAQKEILQSCLRQRLGPVREMGFVSTNKTDGDVNLAIFRIKGTTLNDH